MLSPFTADERKDLFDTNRSSLFDKCEWYKFGLISDPNTGEDIEGYVLESELDCGFSYSKNQVNYNFGNGVENILIDGLLRVAYFDNDPNQPKPKDRIKLTHKLGQMIAPVFYDVLNVSVGHGVLVCQLKATVT